jgi:hypothetical protein
MSGPSVKIVTDGGLSWEGVPSVELLTELIILATRAPSERIDKAVDVWDLSRQIDVWDLSRQIAALMPRADVEAAIEGAR